jgi:LysR family glycine cleavage system transcriptional activator
MDIAAAHHKSLRRSGGAVMRRLPPLGALEAFVVVAQRGSLKGASADLSLSASALSRRIQSLEVHLGTKVFDRLQGEIRLNAAGESLLREVEPALDELSRVLTQARGDGAEILRMGVTPAFANAWLLPRLSRFKARHPAIDVQLDTAPKTLTRLASGLDATIEVAEHADEVLYSRRLRQQLVLAACSPALRDAGPPIRTPADLQHHTVLLHRRMPELLGVWLSAMDASVHPKRVEYYDSGPLLLEAAVLGLGIAFVFDTMAGPYFESGRLVRPYDEHIESPLNYWFFCRQAALSKRPVRRFHDWLFEETEAQAGGGEAASANIRPSAA